MRIRKILGTAVCSLAFLSLSAQADPVLMTVDGEPVTRAEFEAIYKKNNKEANVSREALDEYLELFINYKLKVREAEMLGMDTVSRFRNELDGYRKQLARPYLIDRELNDVLMREAYDRMREEVRASHILVQVGQDATPEDTLAAWKRINALRDRVAKGEDFATVAKGPGGSDDPSAANNGGDLGWFSGLQMVYPFESAAYNTPVGGLSQAVRTRFGYHIIRVDGRRPARGRIKVAHIMLRSVPTDPEERRADAENRIREIHQQLGSGAITFADAALRHSEDESSSTRGGELPEFGTGKMIDEFEDAAFALKADGDISEPVLSRFGWHIIKRLEYTPTPGFEAAKGELKSKIARDSRAEITRKAFLEKLRADYKVVERRENLRPLYALVDSTIFKKGTTKHDTIARRDLKEGEWSKGPMRYSRELVGMMHEGKMVSVRSKQYEELTHTMTDTLVVRDVAQGWRYDRRKAEKLTKPVLVIKDRTYTQRDLLDHLEAKQRRERVTRAQEHVDARFREYVDEQLLAYEDDHLEEKYMDFRLLMKEYRDGILLFELTDQKVWGRAVRDTSGLEAFHAANRDRFMWDTRYEADIYTCADAAVAKQVRSLLRKGTRGADLMKAVNKSSALALDIDPGTFTAEQRPVLRQVKSPGLSADIPHEGRVVIVDLKRTIPPTPKELDEARGAITAAYQDNLERAWIEELRGKYRVEVRRDVLYSIQ
ncbi:MAG: peptidylprolyl isomerase [Flavobacteriales bacterium]|nr:peptidylprolyl isomerase [Flavobacteriales bacterium]